MLVAYCSALFCVFFGDICTFFSPPPSWSYESSWIKNPCITKQLYQKPPAIQQGSAAPYLMPRWEMKGDSVSGWEGPQDGNKGGRTARASVWVTDAATFNRVSSGWTVCIARLVYPCLKAHGHSRFVSFTALRDKNYCLSSLPKYCKHQSVGYGSLFSDFNVVIPLPGGFVHKAS